jgi:hypothetical protein
MYEDQGCFFRDRDVPFGRNYFTLTSCKKSGTPEQGQISQGATSGEPSTSQPNPERNAYFGETHVHTSWSFDAFIFGIT